MLKNIVESAINSQKNIAVVIYWITNNPRKCLDEYECIHRIEIYIYRPSDRIKRNVYNWLLPMCDENINKRTIQFEQDNIGLTSWISRSICFLFI